MLTVVHDTECSNEKNDGVGRSLLDEIVRDGARQMLAAALQTEVATYIDAHAGEVNDNGRRLVVRNGYHRERDVLTAAGAVSVRAPRVNDRRVDPDTGERQRFSSAILPAWARKSPQMTEVLPLLYLHGLSTGDFGAGAGAVPGLGAGLSATTITRLTSQWQDEAKAFQDRDLSVTDYVYLWVDGIHLKVRLEQGGVGSRRSTTSGGRLDLGFCNCLTAAAPAFVSRTGSIPTNPTHAGGYRRRHQTRHIEHHRAQTDNHRDYTPQRDEPRTMSHPSPEAGVCG